MNADPTYTTMITDLFKKFTSENYGLAIGGLSTLALGQSMALSGREDNRRRQRYGGDQGGYGRDQQGSYGRDQRARDQYGRDPRARDPRQQQIYDRPRGDRQQRPGFFQQERPRDQPRGVRQQRPGPGFFQQERRFDGQRGGRQARRSEERR